MHHVKQHKTYCNGPRLELEEYNTLLFKASNKRMKQFVSEEDFHRTTKFAQIIVLLETSSKDAIADRKVHSWEDLSDNLVPQSIESTQRRQSPSCIRSNALFISPRVKLWVIYSSTLISCKRKVLTQGMCQKSEVIKDAYVLCCFI